MTATEAPTLDALLAAAVPQDDAPFDLARVATDVGSWEPGRSEAAYEQLARHVNAERVKTEDARRVAAALEAECAAKDAAIAEALELLEKAESWSVDENSAGFIAEAIEALGSVDQP